MTATRRSSRTLLRVGISLAALSLYCLSNIALAQQTDSAQWSRQEQDAVKVVKNWMAAWETKDAAKVGAYMSDDVIFRTWPERAPQKGRGKFVAEIATFMPAIEWMKALHIEAIGGERGTAVLVERTEKFANYQPLVPAAAFFRVTDGKIVEWLDIPLVKELPPPPVELPAPPEE